MSMKTTRLFPIIAAMLFFINAYGDVIPENTHFVTKCVRITNLADYPEVSLLGFVLPFGGSNGYYSYLISDSACLHKAYKYDGFDIYAVLSSYLEGKDTENMDLANDNCALISSVKVNPSGEYLHDSIPVSSLEQFYKIVGFTDSTVVLYKWKEITGFNDGTPQSTIFFDYKGDISQLSPQFPEVIAHSVTKVTSHLKQSYGITLYPNPGKDILVVDMISGYHGTVYTDIFSMNGEIVKSVVLSKTNVNNSFTIYTNDLNKGTYIVRMRFGDLIESQKLSIY